MIINIKLFYKDGPNLIVSALDDEGCDIGDIEDDILHLTDDFLSYREDDDFILLQEDKAKQLADYIYKAIGK